jgi:protein SCO1
VTSLPGCGVAERRRHRAPTHATAVALAVALTGLLTGCGQGTGDGRAADGPITGLTTHDDDGLNGVVLPDPYTVTDVSLTATDRSTYQLGEDAHRPLTVVFFGYTHCPDICQVVMADIASAMTRLDPGERSKVGMLFVTTDPARDDPATLSSYLDRFDPTFVGLTGPLPRVVEAGKSLGVPIEKGQRLPSGGYEVAHGTQVIGLLPDGSAPVVWTQGTSPAQLAEDIHTILTDGVPSGVSS